MAPFSAEAIECIAQVTEGTPRMINVACDNALTEAYGDGAKIVERPHILDVCRDLQWQAPAPPLIEAPASSDAKEDAAIGDPNMSKPAPAAWANDSCPMSTLERYSVAAVAPSFLTRLRNKFRSPRTEIA